MTRYDEQGCTANQNAETMRKAGFIPAKCIFLKWAFVFTKRVFIFTDPLISGWFYLIYFLCRGDCQSLGSTPKRTKTPPFCRPRQGEKIGAIAWQFRGEFWGKMGKNRAGQNAHFHGTRFHFHEAGKEKGSHFCKPLMFQGGIGGPSRTRTYDQGIMSQQQTPTKTTANSKNIFKKIEKITYNKQQHSQSFSRLSRTTVKTIHANTAANIMSRRLEIFLTIADKNSHQAAAVDRLIAKHQSSPAAWGVAA